MWLRPWCCLPRQAQPRVQSRKAIAKANPAATPNPADLPMMHSSTRTEHKVSYIQLSSPVLPASHGPQEPPDLSEVRYREAPFRPHVARVWQGLKWGHQPPAGPPACPSLSCYLPLHGIITGLLFRGKALVLLLRVVICGISKWKGRHLEIPPVATAAMW